jgi:hypothetical protein
VSLLKKINALPQTANQRWTAWEEFRRDENLRHIYNISHDEMEALKRVALMGTLLSKEDFIFVLGTIRAATR